MSLPILLQGNSDLNAFYNAESWSDAEPGDVHELTGLPGGNHSAIAAPRIAVQVLPFQ